MARVGWIGLGAMGLPMASRLLAAGHEVIGYDVDAPRVTALHSAGGVEAASVADLARKTEIVFSMAWDDASLADLTQEGQGVRSDGSICRYFVDLSTVSLAASQLAASSLSSAGIQFLRCPVSGSAAIAASGDLGLFVSGPRDAYETLLPLLECFSRVQTFVGEADEARLVKLSINLLLQMNSAALGEALALAVQGGVPAEVFFEALNNSILASPHYSVRGKAYLDRNMQFGGRGVAAKDAEIALRTASQIKAILPIGTLVHQQIAQIANRQSDNNLIMDLIDFAQANS